MKLILFLFPIVLSAGTFTAATCNQADVNTIINGPTHTAVDGDIIVIPAGICTWTSSVAISSVGITIHGSGTPNTTPSTFGAGTVTTHLVDNAGSSNPLFTMTGISFGQTFRLELLDIEPNSTSTALISPISLAGTCTASGCPNVRVDNVIFGQTTQWTEAGNGTPSAWMIRTDNVFGVLDHNTIPAGGDATLLNANLSAYLGVGGFGDNSWAQPDTFGGPNVLYIENNSVSGGSPTVTDCDNNPVGGAIGGCRIAARFNVFSSSTSNGFIYVHGLDTDGRPQGGRQIEVYSNTATCTSGSFGGCQSMTVYRSGTGYTFNNTMNVSGTGFYNEIVAIPVYRTVFTNNFGACGGSGAWDTNDGITYYSGTNSGSSGSTTLTDSTKTWTINQFIPSGAPFSVYNVTQGWWAEIASNTATTLTIAGSIPEQTNVFNSGDSYQILRATVCADQGGRGAGNYISGSSPLPAAPLSQALDPIYEWNNTVGLLFHGNVQSSTLRTIANRDWYTDGSNGAPQTQTSAGSPFNGTSGVGFGVIAFRPSTCTAGVGYWATDQGNWNQSGSGGQGQLYKCPVTNTWALAYTPYTYPHPLTSASVPLNVKVVTVKTSGGTYTPSQLQTAIDDGVAYQDTAGQCIPYVIQIDAGLTATVKLVLGAKTCKQYLEVRSSAVDQIRGRVNPATQSALLATIQSPNGGAVISTVDFSNASYYAFRGLKLTVVPAETSYPFVLVVFGDSNVERIASQAPSKIEVDRCWLTGVPNEEGPDEALFATGSSLYIHDNWIEYGQSTYFDAQGTLFNTADGVVFSNNYTSGTAESLFVGETTQNKNINLHGNYSTKPFSMKWSNGTSAPTGTCFYDSVSGERYTQFAAAWPAGYNVTGAVNNGAGLIRVSVSGSLSLTTGNTVQVTDGIFGVSGGALGPWVVTVIDSTHFDLQGSVFSGTYAGSGRVQKVTQLWYCNAGTWTMTSTLFGSNWNIKNLWELKGGTNISTYGNIFANTWPGGQDEIATMNQVNGPDTLDSVTFYANKGINADEGFAIGGLGVESPHAPENVSIHDNLFPSLKSFWPENPFYHPNMFQISTGSYYTSFLTTSSLNTVQTSVTVADPTNVSIGQIYYSLTNFELIQITGVTGSTVTISRGYFSTTPTSQSSGTQFNALAPLSNLQVRHNTFLGVKDTMAMILDAADVSNFPATFVGFNAFSDNLIDHGFFGVTTQLTTTSPGWCAWEKMNRDGGTLFGHNIYSTVAEPSFVTDGFSLAFASTPNCSSGGSVWSYTNTDTWLHTADYSTVFTSVSGPVNTWDYHCLTSYAPCHNAASDGRDIGADITLVNTATAHAVDGAPNPWFNMQVKTRSTVGVTGTTIFYVAPTTDPCTLTLYSNETLTTSVLTRTDTGGNPARSVSIGPLAIGFKWPVLSCASGAYVLSTSAGVVPFDVR